MKTIAAITIALLASCTPQQLETFRAIPITIGIEGEQGTYSYSSKGGLVIQGKVRSDK